MAFARSLHTFNCSKKMNCELCKAVYTSIALKALVMDQYTVQWAVPSKENTNRQRANKQQNTQNHNKTKTRQKPQRSGIATSSEKRSARWHLCVIMSMATENEAKRRQHGTTRRGHENGWKKQQSSLRKPGIPPSQDPRDHREQPFRHDVHPGTPKQTTTTPCRNERSENENRWNRRWDMV